MLFCRHSQELLATFLIQCAFGTVTMKTSWLQLFVKLITHLVNLITMSLSRVQIENICTLPKEFHVSPFYDIKGEYKFDFTKKNAVKINYYFDKTLQLCTSIKGVETPWNDINLLKTFIQYPFYTAFIITLIHYQAIKLFFKENKYFPKPIKLSQDLTYDKNE